MWPNDNAPGHDIPRDGPRGSGATTIGDHMSKPAAGAAAAAAAALGAWLAAPVVAMRRQGSLTDQQVAAIRGDSRLDHNDPEDRQRAAVRRARVREAQVRAAMAAIPEQRRDDDLPMRSPLHW